MKKYYLLLFLILTVVFSGKAQNYKYGKVSGEEVKSASYSGDKEADAAVLYRHQYTYYEYNSNSGFTLVTEIQERVKIYKKEGFDWATKEIPYYQSGGKKEEVSMIRGETYFIENGKVKSEKLDKDAIFDEETNKYHGKVKFTMPAIKEGCVVEYKYIIRSPFLSSIDKMPLQYTIPIKKLELKVVIPEFLTFQKYVNPRSSITYNIQENSKNFTYNSQQSVRQDGSLTGTVTHSMRQSKVEYKQNIYSIDKEDIPALKKEGYVDYLGNYQAFISWELMFTKFPNSPVENYSQTWDGVVSKIYENSDFGGELKKSNFFEDDVQSALSGITAQEQKAYALFNLVKSKVKWDDFIGYYAEKGVKSAYKEGSGSVADINLLLVAMLRYSGLDANPVLISTISHGVPMFPTQDGFNYVVASVNINNQTVLLDATDPYATPNFLPSLARNWQGRLIRKDGTSDWVNLMPTQFSDNKTVLNIKFDDEFNLEGKVIHLLDGYFAKSYREDYLDVNKDSYIKDLEKNKGSIEISNVETENSQDLLKAIKETYDFNLTNAVEKVGDKVYLKPLLFLATTESPFKADERKYPIFFNYPSSVANVVNIIIPEGYKVESVPESTILNFNGGAGSFKFVISQQGQFLRVNTEFQMKTTVYSPSDYEALKNFYNELVQKNTEAVVLTKT